MKFIKAMLLFVAGAGTGFAVGYFLSKKKYEKKADTEIESVKRAFNKHLEELYKDGELKDIPETRNGYTKKSESNQKQEGKPNIERSPLPTDPVDDKYKDYSAPYRVSGDKEKKQAPKKEKEGPYVISPEEFMTSSYEAVTLLYYADGVLADDDNNVISSYREMIGPNALECFGQYQDDTVYVRNDKEKVDYEILLDAREFSKIQPHSSNPKYSLQTDEDNE